MIAFITVLALRLSVCLPVFRRKTGRRISKGSIAKTKTMVVFGSGGHTAEMIKMIQALSSELFGPFFFVLAASDSTSMGSIEAAKLSYANSVSVHKIFRSREVHQSWLLTVFTTAWSLCQSCFLVATLRPDVLLANGPGKVNI